MTVQTGVRKNASTTSKVSFIVSGENGDSGVRRLYDGHRKVAKAHLTNNLIISDPRSAPVFYRWSKYNDDFQYESGTFLFCHTNNTDINILDPLSGTFILKTGNRQRLMGL